MNAEAPSGSEQIELHFCRRCGISIPQGDIDTRRARAVPGGFICEACVMEGPVLESAPAPVGAPVAPRTSRGMQAVVLLALLYVVGATSFLLARELTREPPPAPRTDVATASDLDVLAGRIEALDQQARGAFAELKGNDERQRGELQELGQRVNVLREDLPSGGVLERRLDDLEAVAKAAATKIDLVREDVDAARRELRQIRERAASGAPGPVTKVAEPPAEPVRPPERSQEEIERERLVREYIGTLGDKKASNQTRYNAAVQLGDLRHPDAIPALMKALEEDSYDLVCRAAAWSLGMYGQDAIIAIPALIRQLGGKDGYVGYMCERALGEITKAATGTATSFGFDPTMTQRQRRKVQKDWEEWWEQHRAELMPDAG